MNDIGEFFLNCFGLLGLLMIAAIVGFIRLWPLWLSLAALKWLFS